MIDKIGHYSLTNPASVYDEEGLTALELAGRTAGKVNECVEQFNRLETETNKHLKKQDEDIPVKVDEAVDNYIQQGAFDEAIDEYAGELTDRLDNLVASSGDDNTELVDTRLGAFGTSYETSGEAVREQVMEVSRGTCKPNLIDMNALTPGYVQSTGDYHNSHQTGNFNSWVYTSDFIPIELNVAYQLSIIHKAVREGWYSISVYDKDKNFLNRDRTYNYTLNHLSRGFSFWGEDEAYVRISYRSYTDGIIKFEKSQYATLIEKEETSTNLIDTYPLQFDGYIVTNGSIYPATDKAEKYTRHIPVTPGEEYTLYNISASNQWYRVAFYGVNGVAIHNVSGSENKTTFEIPSNTVTMMLSVRTASKPLLGLFKNTNVMTAEQQVFENYIKLLEEKTSTTANNVDYDMYVKGIAHRGYAVGDEIPENTASAFIEAYKRGFKYVECDVRVTSDGAYVLCHDETVDRVSNGTGNVSDMRLEEIKALTVGNNEKFLTLVEFVALCKKYGLKPYIELKGDQFSDNDEGMGYVRGVLACVQGFGMLYHSTFLSFDENVVVTLLESDFKIRVGWLVDTFNDDVFNVFIKSDLYISYTHNRVVMHGGEFFVCCQYSNLETSSLIYEQIPVEVWTCDDEEYIKSMSSYITGVVSNSVHAGRILHESDVSFRDESLAWDEINWKFES